MKHILVLLSIILALIPKVFAEDDKWIDGIKIRAGHNVNITRFRMPWEGDIEIIETSGASQTITNISYCHCLTRNFDEFMVIPWRCF